MINNKAETWGLQWRNHCRNPLNGWKNSCKHRHQNQDFFFKSAATSYKKSLQMGYRRLLGTAFGLLGGGFWITLASKGSQDEKRDEHWHGGPSFRGSILYAKSLFFGKQRYRAWKNGFPEWLWKKCAIWKGQSLKIYDPDIIFNCFLSARTFNIKQKRWTVV